MGNAESSNIAGKSKYKDSSLGNVERDDEDDEEDEFVDNDDDEEEEEDDDDEEEEEDDDDDDDEKDDDDGEEDDDEDEPVKSVQEDQTVDNSPPQRAPAVNKPPPPPPAKPLILPPNFFHVPITPRTPSRDGDGKSVSESASVHSDNKSSVDDLDNEKLDFVTLELESHKLLSQDDILKIEHAFYHFAGPDRQNFLGLSEDQLGVALAILGVREKAEIVREEFNKTKVDPMPLDIFVEVVARLRKKKIAEGQENLIEQAFDSIYAGTNPAGDNRDESGRKFIDPVDLRRLLTTQGDKFSDEEADQLIRDCDPIYVDNPIARTRQGRIFFEQYRNMLLAK